MNLFYWPRSLVIFGEKKHWHKGIILPQNGIKWTISNGTQLIRWPEVKVLNLQDEHMEARTKRPPTFWRHCFECIHDDVIKWKHFPPYWPFVRGIHGEFPEQRPVTGSFDVFFDLCLIKRLSKHSRGWWLEMLSPPLWRHYNVSLKKLWIVSIV